MEVTRVMQRVCAVLSSTVVLAGLLAPARLLAQAAGEGEANKSPATALAAPMTTVPCMPQQAAQTPAQHAHAEQMKNDWPWLGRYKQADLELGPPAPGEERVVFMGASITERWHFAGPHGFFPASPISTGASADRPRRRCCFASART